MAVVHLNRHRIRLNLQPSILRYYKRYREIRVRVRELAGIQAHHIFAAVGCRHIRLGDRGRARDIDRTVISEVAG